ncbi:MerR family transcriptional regulator [Nocardia tengchongensis]|uniref:MerR family transcriptional regulator n=1 Tax=Nocardia tengchongensis TaxID=2055889 RepID=UPI0036B1C6B2
MVGGAEYTIDELARVAGTTVRSVRVYHERGVLPPPEVRGRTGYYGVEHLNRVRTISRLLDRGIKLNGIKELLAAWDRGDDLGAVLGVAEAAEVPATDPAVCGELISATDLQQRFVDVPNGLARVVTAGVYEPVDATTYRIADADRAALLQRLAAAGVPNAEILTELDRLAADSERIARRISDLVQKYAWEPFASSERTPGDLAELVARVDTLRSAPARAIGESVRRQIERRLEQDEELAAALREA